MSDVDWLIPMVVGGLFIFLGLAAIFWGKREQKSYDESLSTRADLREFMEHWPPRPEPGALKIGGWIAVVVGLVMLVLGTVFLLWG
ncbi:hypothetical protein ACFLV4_01015 [Chloroflexota bacterium]